MEALASTLLIGLAESQDKLDTIGSHFGVYSIDYKEALEEHWKKYSEIHELVTLGLKVRENKNGNV